MHDYLTHNTTVMVEQYTDMVRSGATAGEIARIQDVLVEYARWLEMALTPLVEYAP